MREQKKRKIIIGALCGVVLLMIVGYAAFSSLLNISGTAGIKGQWNIEITEITSNIVNGSPTDVSTSIGENKLSASFETKLLAPGDIIEYNIKVENKGNIDATLTNMNPTEITSTNPAIEFTKSGLEVGNDLPAGTEKILTIQVKYLDVTELKSTENTTFTISLEFSQAGTTGGGTGGYGDAANKLIALAIPEESVWEDGLYADGYEEGKYTFKGSNPNNYITFNDETWRIMSIESDGTIKIIRNHHIDSPRSWDNNGARINSENTYCSISPGNDGCNAWAATNKLVGNPTEFSIHYPKGSTTLGNPYATGTVTQDSTLNTYLNETYYNTLSETAKSQITSHNFNVGTPGNDTDSDDMGTADDMATNIQQEALYKWNGKVGLMTFTEVIRASNHSKISSGHCTTIQYAKDDSLCYGNTYNWLSTNSENKWTISPYPEGVTHVWKLGTSSLSGEYAQNSNYIYPVVYLRANIDLQTDAGQDGTSDNPYTIN